MNKLVALVILIATSVTVYATIISSFAGWNNLIKESPDIIVVRGLPPPAITNSGPWEIIDGGTKSDVEVLCVLKGKTSTGKSHTVTDWHKVDINECYVIFGHYHDGEYQAIEDYRVIPIGNSFNTNDLSGKSLNAQIRLLLQRRVDFLNDEIKKDTAEKKRLEEGLK